MDFEQTAFGHLIWISGQSAIVSFIWISGRLPIGNFILIDCMQSAVGMLVGLQGNRQLGSYDYFEQSALGNSIWISGQSSTENIFYGFQASGNWE